LQEPLRKGNGSSNNIKQSSTTQQEEQQGKQSDQLDQQQQAASTTNGSAALDTQGYSAQDAGRGEAARARCLQAMAGFSETFLQIIAGTPGTCLVEHGIYVRPAAAMTPAAYGSDRVVVMGDAAHPLRPTGEAGTV
jgi:2-polyprenyl-6-methoxyphenol hydroxylase-like FAD-dependent oxidoreductase